jgi:hypothetical protein
MSGQDAARILGAQMWEYEKSEIPEFETVYFFNV